MNYYSQISWVDDYIKNVRDYIYVRQADNLLIKIPNEVHKLNHQGVKILKHLLGGKSIHSFLENYSDKEKAAFDVHNFFCDIRAVLKGCLHEQDGRRAVEKVPFTLQFNTLPVLSEIAITYSCNLSCKFCYASCGCRKEDIAELDTGSIKDVLRIIKNEAEVPSVSFTGGEPLLRKDLFELISFAKSLKMWVNLITNATLITSDIAETLKDSGLDSAQVSLEGGEEKLHDSIVQYKGAYQKTIEGVKNLKEEGIRVHTNTTISRMNKKNLLEILEVVKKLGLDKLSMNMLMPEGSAVKNLAELFVSYTEIGEIALGVKSRAQELGLEFLWYSPTPVCIFNPIVYGLGNKGCSACDGLLSINPCGDILPCSSFPKPMGNILKMKGKFRKFWRSSKFAFFQKKKFAPPRCKKCEYLPLCNGACPLYWKAVGFGELSSSCSQSRRNYEDSDKYPRLPSGRDYND